MQPISSALVPKQQKYDLNSSTPSSDPSIPGRLSLPLSVLMGQMGDSGAKMSEFFHSLQTVKSSSKSQPFGKEGGRWEGVGGGEGASENVVVLDHLRKTSSKITFNTHAFFKKHLKALPIGEKVV